jgi:dynein light chain 4
MGPRLLSIVTDKMAEVSDKQPATTTETTTEYDYKRLHNFPLIKYSDMNEELRMEAMELCVTACEKHAANNELAAKMIKETMDKKFGGPWHAIVGEGYSFEITYNLKNLLYMFFGGSMAICVWKCT